MSDKLTKWDWIAATTLMTSGILVLLSILGWLGRTGQYLGAGYGLISILFMWLAESEHEDSELVWEYEIAEITTVAAGLGFLILYLGAPWLPISYEVAIWLGLAMLAGGILIMEKFSEEVKRNADPA